jgi:hypothetical protein
VFSLDNSKGHRRMSGSKHFHTQAPTSPLWISDNVCRWLAGASRYRYIPGLFRSFSTTPFRSKSGSRQSFEGALVNHNVTNCQSSWVTTNHGSSCYGSSSSSFFSHPKMVKFPSAYPSARIHETCALPIKPTAQYHPLGNLQRSCAPLHTLQRPPDFGP